MSIHYRNAYRSEGWATEIYPMPAFPQLAVADLARAATWYQQVLGFADVFTMRGGDGAPLLAHLRWCTFGDVLLAPARAAHPGSVGAGVTLCFAGEADAIAARAATHGVLPVEGPVDRPWNAREVTFTDPDGYRLTFTGPTAEFHARIADGDIERIESVVQRLRDAFHP